MPYKFAYTKKKIPPELDRRRKLSDEDYEDIKRLYFREKLGIREIARQYENKCSRRLIQFVLFPERANRVNFPGHWKKHYDKTKHTTAIRKHRRHKQLLAKEKKLV